MRDLQVADISTCSYGSALCMDVRNQDLELLLRSKCHARSLTILVAVTPDVTRLKSASLTVVPVIFVNTKWIPLCFAI